MESDGSWHSLVLDPQLSILSLLKQRKDRDSLQAMMQTSRELRLLTSSPISSIEIRHAFALAHFPKHAAAITSMRLCMCPSPGEAHMEPYCMVSWLQSTSATCNRLATVTSVRVELPVPNVDEEEEFEPMEPAVMDCLLASIGQACPSLRSLHMDGINHGDEELVRAMFTAIGRHLPGIVELQLELDANFVDEVDNVSDFDIAGIDWAACLPRGLQKFSSPVHLHHELLQQLVLMPSLAEVTVLSLGDEAMENLGEEAMEVQSDSCAWRSLRLSQGLPSFQVLASFTAAMPLLHIPSLNRGFHQTPHQWCITHIGGSGVDRPIVAKAAAWLSHINNYPKRLTIRWGWRANYWPDAASTVGFISALAPLSGLYSLELVLWPITVRTLDELALALPNVKNLTLNSCSISSGAWLRMASLVSVTHLEITHRQARHTISLEDIVEFMYLVSHPMTIHFNHGTVSEADRVVWEEIKGILEEQRWDAGLPHITVLIPTVTLRSGDDIFYG